MMSVPSRPRLMRPLFSVRHSPRLTKINGVLTRMAPPISASGTPHNPMDPPSAIGGLLSLEDLKSAVERFEGQNHQEQNALKHQNSCIRQMLAALKQPAACAD